MQLSTEDKERIHREARNKTNDHYQSKLSAEIANDAYYKGYKVGAEYATIYEREKQAKPLTELDDIDKRWPGSEITQLKSKIIKLEAERTEVRNNIIDECIYALHREGMTAPRSILNSLKTK